MENSQIYENQTTYSWIINELRKKSKGNQKIPWDKNGNTTYQNLWDAAKAVLTGKVIISMYTLREKISNRQPNLKHQEIRKRANSAQS